MRNPDVLKQFVEALLEGDRNNCRMQVRQQLQELEARDVYTELLWPAMEQVDRLHRTHRINRATEQMATRLLRVLADQLQTALVPNPSNGRCVVVACADGEPEELGAQMTADLFEADGWCVYFIGGGVPNDEILSLVGQLRPDLLLIFGTRPQGVPGVRQLIDLIRDIDPNPTMNVMTSGGVFNRADGLWKEVNADLYARTAAEALGLAGHAEPRTPQPKAPGVPKKRRRRRRPPLLAALEAAC